MELTTSRMARVDGAPSLLRIPETGDKLLIPCDVHAYSRSVRRIDNESEIEIVRCGTADPIGKIE